MGSANPQLANMQLWLLAFLSALLWSTTFGQTPLSSPNLNYSLCWWTEIRAAAIRDTLYIDGGQMYVTGPGDIQTANGQQTTMYYLNYTNSFLVSDPWNKSLTSMPDGPSLKDAFYNGYMFADDFELWLYGGLASASTTGDGQNAPPNYIWGYEFFPDGSSIDEPVLGPSGTSATLPSNVNRYLTNGAGVNVHSEKLGFYFSGMTGTDAKSYNLGTAQTPSATLLQVDMSNEETPNWTNSTLPSTITARADAALVWVPVGTNGTLLAIGGVVNPEELFFGALTQAQQDESEAISPLFMKSIAVYDIANRAWYLQNVSGVEYPGQLTQFCSVMVSEETPSSYQIYIYGGYNGIIGTGANLAKSAPNNDVWVLSVPSFTWTKVFAGDGTGGRSGHFCTAPYPDQMLVVGGYGGGNDVCLDTFIKVFNLNTLTWQSGYNPSTWSQYKIPTVVANAIAAHPTASWSDPKLSTLFDTKYTKNMTVFYPYTNLTPHKSTGVAAIAGGAAAGGVCLLVLVGAILWYRRKQHKKPPRAGDAEVQPYEQVNMWRNGVPKTEPSVTTTEIGDTSDVNPNTGGYYNPGPAAEIAGDDYFRRHSAASPRPGGFAEAGGGTRRISGVPTMSPRSPRSPRSPNLGTLDAQEVEGEERYEMEDMQGHRGSGDNGARSRFRDHHLYPLSVSDGDGRSQTSGPSYSGPSHSYSQASRGDANRNVPSPYIMAHPGGIIIDDNSNAELPASPVRPNHLQHTRNISSLSSLGNGNGGHGFPQVSPPLEQQPNPMTTPPTHTRTTSEDELDALEAFHTGMVPSRPSHKRNASSMSSRLNQLPTPDEELPEAERNRQSTLLAKLPSPTVGSAAASPLFEQERNPLLSAATLAGNGAERDGRPQSPSVPVVGGNGNGNGGRGGVMVGDELYSPSYYSQGSTLVTSARSPISRRPVGQGFEGDVGKGGGKGTF